MKFQEFELISNDVTVWKQKLSMFCSRNASTFQISTLGPGKVRFIQSLGRYLNQTTSKLLSGNADVDWECK